MTAVVPPKALTALTGKAGGLLSQWSRFLPKPGGGGAVGLDVGSAGFKIVELTKQGTQTTLQRAVVEELPTTDRKAMAAALKAAFERHQIGSRRVNSSLSGPAVVVRYVELPAMTDQELASAIQFEAEKYLPFNPAECVTDSCVIEKLDHDKRMRVLLAAAKKSLVEERLDLLQEAGLVPQVIDVDAFAIENMYDVNYSLSPGEITALVNIGASVMNVNILKAGTCVFTRDISIGGGRYTEAIQHELGASYEEAEAAKKGDARSRLDREAVAGALTNVNTEVVSEIANSIDYFRTTNMDGEVSKIVLCGGCAKVKGLADQLSHRLAAQVEVANPFAEIDISNLRLDPEVMESLAPLAAVGVGLALRRPGDR